MVAPAYFPRFPSWNEYAECVQLMNSIVIQENLRRILLQMWRINPYLVSSETKRILTSMAVVHWQPKRGGLLAMKSTTWLRYSAIILLAASDSLLEL